MRLTLTAVTLDQLVDELHKLRFAGWGASKVEFSATGGRRTSIEMFLFRDVPPKKPETK